MRLVICFAALLIPSKAGAQPYSESMADCASLFQNAAQWVKTDESADQMMHAATQWAEAAVAQSRSEGQEVTPDDIWQRIDSKTDQWEAKGARVFFSQEFRDWSQYCRKFAKDRGVILN